MTCFECGSGENIHQHHVVPKSKGGTKTIPLCAECHSKVHGRSMHGTRLTASALRHKKACRKVYNHAPFGFQAVDGELVPDASEQRDLAKIFEMRAAGLSLRAIAADLNGRGVSGKHGGVFHASTIRAILANDIHA